MAETVTIESFLPYVALHCMGIPAPTMLHEIRSASILFCERSRVWKEQSTVTVRENRADYEVPCPDEAVLVVVEEVYFDGVRLDPIALDALHDRWRNWQALSGDPTLYAQVNPLDLTLVPKPARTLTQGLSLRASYKPDRTAATVPDWLFQQWAEVIAAGALWRLMSTNSLPCFNPQLAMAFGQAFSAGADKALHRADKGFTRAPRRTVARFM